MDIINKQNIKIEYILKKNTHKMEKIKSILICSHNCNLLRQFVSRNCSESGTRIRTLYRKAHNHNNSGPN